VPAGATEGGGESQLERRVKLVTSVVAPTTVLTALLFYYGYVTTVAEYGYFGISMGSLDLSYQDVLLNSIGALYVPLGLLLLVILGGLWAHLWFVRHGRSRLRPRTVRLAGFVLIAVGALAFLRGVLGVVVPAIARTEWIALSPICLGVGVSAIAYGRRLLAPAPGVGGVTHKWAETASTVTVCGLVVLSLFWAANSFAAAYGRGQAEAVVDRLWKRPAVVLDTPDRLFVKYPGVVETALPTADGQAPRYRYRGFRLLVEANDRLFLLPDQWRRDGGAALVLETRDDLGLQFYRTG
jgi:uncharacterized membrane protein YbaN (DUF454 family)